MGWWDDVTGRSSAPSPKSQSDAPAGAYLGTRTGTGGSLVATGDRRTGRDSRTGDIVSLISESSGEPSMRQYSESSGTGGTSGGTQTPTPEQPTGPTPEEKLKADQDKAFADALARAMGYGGEQVSNLALNSGLIDQYGILDAYKTAIERQKGSIDPYADTTPTLDEYLNQFKTSDAFQDVLTSGQNRYRADLTNTLSGVAPEGFETTWFGDTMDDPVLQAILDQQRGDATLVLDRAKARGQLNDVGYGRGMTELENQAKAGMGSLQSLGSGVLQGYRGQVGNERTNALSRIGGASFAQPYDASTAVNRLNELKTSLGGSLENDIRAALGGQTFFDTSTAIGRGGATQGTTNPSKINFGANPLLASFAPTQRQGTNTGSTATTGQF